MPFKSKAQQRWMFAAEKRGEVPKGTAKKWARHTPNLRDLPEKKEPEGGFDKSARICPHCGAKLTRYLGGKGYTPNPDRADSYIGCYACDNPECSCFEKKGRKYAVPILSENKIVSENVEVVLNGEKYLLEAGDEIAIEHVRLDD